MAKNNAKVLEEEGVDSVSKIEAIKNLIFGENIQHYDSEFLALKKDINEKREILHSYIDEVRTEIMQTLDNLSTDVNIRITDLEDSLNAKTEKLSSQKVDKKELGKLLIKLGEKISD